MGPTKKCINKRDIPRTPDVSQDLFPTQQQCVPVTLSSVPLDYNTDSIVEEPPTTPNQDILQMIVSPSKLTMIPADAVSGKLGEQDQ